MRRKSQRLEGVACTDRQIDVRKDANVIETNDPEASKLRPFDVERYCALWEQITEDARTSSSRIGMDVKTMGSGNDVQRIYRRIQLLAEMLRNEISARGRNLASQQGQPLGIESWQKRTQHLARWEKPQRRQSHSTGLRNTSTRLEINKFEVS